MKRLALALAGLVGIPLTAADASGPTEIRVALPPDPNAVPVFILEQRQDEFLPDAELELVPNPAGDPSAMRAMVQDGRTDFAFFNLVGGVRFVEGGLDQLELVAPWVWQGIYLLTPEDGAGAKATDGNQVLVAPGLSTPPHVVTERALTEHGITPDFASSGAGMALLAQARNPRRAPEGVAAPEPLVSLILHQQAADDWEQQWAIELDPAQALEQQLDVRIPLGAIWAVRDQVDDEQRQALMQGIEAVTDWLADPGNHEQAARIAAERFDTFFDMPIPEAALLRMLRSERVVWNPEGDEDTRQAVDDYLREVFDTQPPAGL